MQEDPAFVWDAEGPPRRPAPTPSRPPGSPAVPAGPDARTDDESVVLVPIDQWSRILGQLANLHEAGRELAEARERAAKAETEAAFLKERIRDVRERLTAAEELANRPDPEPEPMPPWSEWVTRRWLERRRRREPPK